MSWDQKFLQMALQMSTWSKDQSTKVGCVIVGANREIRSTGYNGMPRRVDDNKSERHIRPNKYLYFEHSERNALFNAARVGIPTNGCTLYVTSTPTKFPPCADCARAIIQCGIVRVVQEPVSGDEETIKRWQESCRATMEMFAEAGIIYDQVEIS